MQSSVIERRGFESAVVDEKTNGWMVWLNVSTVSQKKIQERRKSCGRKGRMRKARQSKLEFVLTSPKFKAQNIDIDSFPKTLLHFQWNEVILI